MSSRSEKLLALGVLSVALAALGLCSGRPFHIDDALFLRCARETALHWGSPYAGEVNWYGTVEPIHAVMRNPPSWNYVLALLGPALAWSERLLHLAQLVPSAVFLLASWALARRWCSSPALALALVAGSPAFLVTSASIMPDTLLAAAWTCAVLAWCRPPSARSSAAAALALLVAALTKWYGLALVPLLLAWELASERRLTLRCLWLLPPLAASVALELWTRATQGVSLLSHAASIAVTSSTPGPAWMHAWSGLAFFGGACAAGLFALPFLARTQARTLLGCAALACLALLLARGRLFFWPALAQASATERWAIAIQLALWGCAGAALLALAIQAAWRGGREARFLALWIGGTLVFALFLNWSFPVRSFLPALPAVAITLARALEGVPFLARPSGRLALAACLAAGGVFGVLLLRADTEVAEEARSSATALVQAHQPARVWFEGHWGFQHYAEAAGARALDRDHPGAQPGDVILVPMLNTNIFGVSQARTRTLDHRVVPLRSPFVVLGPRSGAGFWGDALGPLPFAWNLGDVAETWVFEQR
jgi:hypothetical protein